MHKEDKLGGSEATIRPFFTRIREMHLFSNIFQTQRFSGCRYLASDKKLKKEKHHSLYFGAPNCLGKAGGGTPLPFQYFGEEQEPLLVQFHIVQLQDVLETPHQGLNACTCAREVTKGI